ncbi:hypothetical protein BpHYR1_031304 [Brachionus plicatilis]|uniref:Uncharacterized protein n=1 Tax=Brachionus plicatilis TaxID=10195 RepID=A0A3M7T722_BRAPC|nr:hypothetical protein BpHYR1_031304 [Brachionus plicatilis]
MVHDPLIVILAKNILNLIKKIEEKLYSFSPIAFTNRFHINNFSFMHFPIGNIFVNEKVKSWCTYFNFSSLNYQKFLKNLATTLKGWAVGSVQSLKIKQFRN